VVGKIFCAVALERARGLRGRRGLRNRHLVQLDQWIANCHAIADAFGNTVYSIYNLRFTEELHPM
jgi:hypothetical protein